MVIYVKNKLVTLRGSSFAEDESGNKLFEIRGKLFSPTKKKFVCDLSGNTLYIVRNKYWHLFTKKALIYDGQTNEKICKIKDRIFSIRYDIVDCEDEYAMESEGLFRGITIFKNGEPIGKWSRGTGDLSGLFRDGYRIETDRPEEAALLISFMIAIDNIEDKKKGQRN